MKPMNMQKKPNINIRKLFLEGKRIMMLSDDHFIIQINSSRPCKTGNNE